MNTDIFHNRQRRLREAAILVASLDDHLAERLVASMPTADAAEVRMAVKHLGSIDPDEQDEIAAKFRQSTVAKSPTKADGVELDASLLARIENQEIYASDSETVVAKNPFQTLSSEEETTVVKMLSEEHPQTISIVLSRINPSSAANLLSRFSPSIQADVLSRMTDCNSADEQTVRVIEAQLGHWIDQHRQQCRQKAVGLELAQRVFSYTPESQRKTVLTQLRDRNPDLAGHLTEKANSIHNSYPERNSSVSEDYLAVVGKAPQPTVKTKPFVQTAPQSTAQTTASPIEFETVHPTTELDQLDDATLTAALSQTDRQVVALALAGASDELMKRVLQGLPHRHANKLRSQLRDIGPARLSDILAAQRQLLQNAFQLMPTA